MIITFEIPNEHVDIMAKRYGCSSEGISDFIINKLNEDLKNAIEMEQLELAKSDAQTFYNDAQKIEKVQE